ncbi:MAG: Clp protease ClpP [Spirochaetota bacterium]|nr:Clp protease ClpP [Spirochaetota bacterium]
MKTIALSGQIGAEVRAATIREQLRAAGGQPVTLDINSGGGGVFEGKEIQQLIRDYRGRTTARITGLAASMASAIAVTADELVVSADSVFMMHCASAGTLGNRRDHEKTISILEGIDQQLEELYSQKSGIPADEIRRMMEEETWLYGAEIRDMGFADRLENSSTSKDKAAAISDARARFAASYRQPTPAEIAAFAGRQTSRVKTFDEWRSEFPNNSKVQSICDRAEAAGRSPESCVIALQLATTAGLSEEDKAAAEIAGMSLAEYARYAPKG